MMGNTHTGRSGCTEWTGRTEYVENLGIELVNDEDGLRARPRHITGSIEYNNIPKAATLIASATSLQSELARLIAIYAIDSSLYDLVGQIAARGITWLNCTELENFRPSTLNPLGPKSRAWFPVALSINGSLGRALCIACERNDMATAQWMATTLELTADIARYAGGQPLLEVCSRGYLAMAKWLVKTFGFTAKDARSQDNEALRAACGHGHAETAQWLVRTFGLTLVDINARGGEALRRARKGQ